MTDQSIALPELSARMVLSLAISSDEARMARTMDSEFDRRCVEFLNYAQNLCENDDMSDMQAHVVFEAAIDKALTEFGF